MKAIKKTENNPGRPAQFYWEACDGKEMSQDTPSNSRRYRYDPHIKAVIKKNPD